MNAPRLVVQDFRPDEIHWSYWEEVLDIREVDELLPVELLMEDES